VLVEFKGIVMSSNANPQPSKKLPMRVWLLVLSVAMVGLAAFPTLMACKDPKVFEGAIPGNKAISRDVVTVFFSKAQGSQSIVEDVVRKIPSQGQNSPLEFALQELLKGPTPEEKTQGFYSEIPAGTKLLGLNQDKDKVVINLSRQFTVGGGSNSMVQRFEQIKQTAYSLDSAHPISLAVEGKPLETLGGEGLEVQESLKHEQQ
jgi:spore germination protein GerM